VCSVPEGKESALYTVVSRNGALMLERSTTRQIDDARDMVFMDSALTYDGRNEAETTMTLSGGTTWDSDETLTITADSAFFSASDVGNEIQLWFYNADGDLVDSLSFTLEAYTSSTVMTGKTSKDVISAVREEATTVWARAVDEITGLWHLEGQNVSIFADGQVVASPDNDEYDTVTVTNGAVTLTEPAAVVHVWLPYLSEIETLNISVGGASKKRISKLTIELEETRGLFVGASEDNLYELKMRQSSDEYGPIQLFTGEVEARIGPEWNSHGRSILRQVDPLPCHILGVTPDGDFQGGSQ
jgi:hypothetical protein